MNDLIQKAEEYREYAMIKCNAYYLAARISSKHNLKLGIPVVVLNGIIGTAVFASLSKKTDDVYILAVVSFISVCAAVLSSLQTFLKYSERAENNRSTAVAYERLHHRLDVFLLRYREAAPDVREMALKAFEEIVKGFDETARNSSPIADSLWGRAKEGLKKSGLLTRS